MRKNKKGGISTILLDFWAYILYVLIVLIFYLLFTYFSETEKTNKILSEAETRSAASANLLGYLKSPVTVDGNEITMADLIGIWNENPDKYKEILSKNSDEILNKLEYEYNNHIHYGKFLFFSLPDSDTQVTRGFDLIIDTEKRFRDIRPLIEFKSKNFENGYVVKEDGFGVIQSEQTIPLQNGKTLYIMMMESQKAK